MQLCAVTRPLRSDGITTLSFGCGWMTTVLRFDDGTSRPGVRAPLSGVRRPLEPPCAAPTLPFRSITRSRPAPT
jgi:hypothetical protein